MKNQIAVRAVIVFFAATFAFVMSQAIAANAAPRAASAQATACTYTFSPASLNIPYNAASWSFNIVASEANCAWTAVSLDSWVTITSGASGTGNGTVTFSVTTNTTSDAIRLGRISVAGQTFIIQQGPQPCTFTLQTNGINVSASGGGISVYVNTQQACPWLIGSTPPWITFNSAPGWGSGSAFFTVQPNTGPERTGAIAIAPLGGGAPLIFTVRQARAAGRAAFDFDGDGKADASVFRPSNGVWYLNGSQNGFYAALWGESNDQIVPGDYDGDGKTDFAVFRKSADSTWYILNSADNTFRAARWGASNLEQQLIFFDRAVPGDYDGDGKTDLAVWRRTDNLNEPARFYVLQSSNNMARIQQWGSPFDRFTPAADYDGDGKTDLTIRRGSIWYILQSQTNEVLAVQFGSTGDKAVPADYDGDGRADIAVFRQENGMWYILQSRDGFKGFHFGSVGDRPVPADYDGDGKADIAVWRPFNGTWYLQRSRDGFTGIAFGEMSDKPIPSAFIE